jgi:hypothetical protein
MLNSKVKEELEDLLTEKVAGALVAKVTEGLLETYMMVLTQLRRCSESTEKLRGALVENRRFMGELQETVSSLEKQVEASNLKKAGLSAKEEQLLDFLVEELQVKETP